MACLMRGLVACSLVALGLLAAAPAPACPFCGPQSQSLTMEISQAVLVLYGDLDNAKANDDGTGTTDFLVEGVVKADKAYNGEKKMTFARYLPPIPPVEKYRYLVFCDVFKGKIDP